MSGQILRQQRALDVAGRVEVLLHAGKFHIALVVAGVFEGDGGLQRQALDEVGFVDGQGAAVRGGDHQLGHALAFAVGERKHRHDGRLVAEARCPRRLSAGSREWTRWGRRRPGPCRETPRRPSPVRAPRCAGPTPGLPLRGWWSAPGAKPRAAPAAGTPAAARSMVSLLPGS